MANTVCHIEFNVTDMSRAQAFFEGMFGWTFREFMPEMTVFGNGDQHIGGLMLADKVSPGESPSVWFDVEDIESSLSRATKLGGSVHSPAHPVPTVGLSGVVCDPDGNRVGLVQFTNE